MKNTVLLLLLSSSPAFAQRLPYDDPTLRPYQARTTDYTGRCESGDTSHVGKSNCYADQIKALRARVEAEYKKALIDAETIDDRGEFGGKSAEQRAKEERADVVKAHAAWKAYTSAYCGGLARATERGGGNGGDLDYASCTIRHLVARMNELKR